MFNSLQVSWDEEENGYYVCLSSTIDERWEPEICIVDVPKSHYLKAMHDGINWILEREGHPTEAEIAGTLNVSIENEKVNKNIIYKVRK